VLWSAGAQAVQPVHCNCIGSRLADRCSGSIQSGGRVMLCRLRANTAVGCHLGSILCPCLPWNVRSAGVPLAQSALLRFVANRSAFTVHSERRPRQFLQTKTVVFPGARWLRLCSARSPAVLAVFPFFHPFFSCRVHHSAVGRGAERLQLVHSSDVPRPLAHQQLYMLPVCAASSLPSSSFSV